MTESEPRLFMESDGSGPAVLCLHGFGGSARNFRPQVRALRDRYRVITFDARGHARSEAPRSAEAYEPSAFLADVERVLDDCGEARAALVGLSMGASLAVQFAAAHPERVSCLVLASIPPGGSGDAWALPFADAIDRDGLEAAGERFVWGGSRFDEGARELIRRGFMEHAPHALAPTLRRVLATDPDLGARVEDALNAGIPLLLICGENDSPSVAASEAIARDVPGVRVETIAGAGHVVNLQTPKQFNALADEFFSISHS